MIIRHDIDPTLYLADPSVFGAIAPIASHLEEIPIAYDNIDEMLKPSLLAAVQAEPTYLCACDGMGCLIRPNWMLTAAHVATTLSPHQKIELENTSQTIHKIVLHPQFHSPENITENITEVKNDIALIQLNSPVKTILPLPLYSQNDELKEIVTFVGQGDYGNGLIGPDSVDGHLRLATNQIERVDRQWLMFKFDAPPEGTELEGISGPGDGGGPALLKTENGWAIAGISAGQASRSASGEMLGEGRYGVWGYYTRISQYIDWIQSVIGS